MDKKLLKLIKDILDLEVETLLGDPTKAIKELGWKTNISAKKMCEEMINEDYKARRELQF